MRKDSSRFALASINTSIRLYYGHTRLVFISRISNTWLQHSSNYSFTRNNNWIFIGSLTIEVPCQWRMWEEQSIVNSVKWNGIWSIIFWQWPSCRLLIQTGRVTYETDQSNVSNTSKLIMNCRWDIFYFDCSFSTAFYFSERPLIGLDSLEMECRINPMPRKSGEHQ